MIRKFFSVIQFNLFFLTALTYFLGISIAHYLGFQLRWGIIIEGLVWIFAILISSSYIKSYYEIFFPRIEFQKSGLRPQVERERGMANIFLLTGIAGLAVSLIPLMNLFLNGSMKSITLIIFLVIMAVTFSVELFSNQIATSGLLEFFRAFSVANLSPAIAFVLLSGDIHRLLFLLTFPLLFIYFALFITLSLPKIESGEIDIKYTLLGRLGSVNILRIENLLVLFTYFVFLFEAILDLPWKLVWPALVVLPLGLLQVWQVSQILNGKKPSFMPLLFNAYATAGFTTYFIILALWII